MTRAFVVSARSRTLFTVLGFVLAVLGGLACARAVPLVAAGNGSGLIESSAPATDSFARSPDDEISGVAARSRTLPDPERDGFRGPNQSVADPHSGSPGLSLGIAVPGNYLDLELRNTRRRIMAIDTTLPGDATDGPRARKRAPGVDDAPGTSPVGTDVSEAEEEAGNLTLRDLARSIVNKDLSVSGLHQRPTRVANIDDASSRGFSILNAILDIRIDPETLQAIAKIASPNIDVNGVVSFNLFGMGDFALLVAQDAKRIRILNTQTGSWFLVSYGSSNFDLAERGVHERPVARAAGDPQGQKLANFVRAVRRWIFDYVLHPFSLIGFVLLLIFWTLFRLRGREV